MQWPGRQYWLNRNYCKQPYQGGLDTTTPTWHTRNNCLSMIFLKCDGVVQMATGLHVCVIVGKIPLYFELSRIGGNDSQTFVSAKQNTDNQSTIPV